MASGNKGFAELVANADPMPRAPRLPPRTGILGARENRLAEIASGAAVTRIHEFVDPAVCRIWDGHNRDYGALNETTCGDLIESFRAQGRQEVPAIVRRVSGGGTTQYEVICGARRHWTVTWLRANAYPEFRFLIEPRELTDEEAFRLADLENRSRRDLSDYERATDYARAIERYYGGSQQRMVDRLDVTKSWLSRYLELARLPREVLESFGSPAVIKITHAAVLAPLLRAPKTRAKILVAAARLAEEQAALVAAGSCLSPAVVVRRLKDAAEGRPPKRIPRTIAIRTPDGAILAKGERAASGTVGMTLPHAATHDRGKLMHAIADLLEQLLSQSDSVSSAIVS